MSKICCKGCYTELCDGGCGRYLCPTSGHREYSDDAPYGTIMCESCASYPYEECVHCGKLIRLTFKCKCRKE